MPIHESGSQAQRLIAIERLFLLEGNPTWSLAELAAKFEVSVDTIGSDLSKINEAGRIALMQIGKGPATRWSLNPDFTKNLPPLLLDFSQGAALYAATRLLSQQHDERNDAIRTAILQLIGILPKALHASLFALAADLDQRSTQRPEVTDIFTALSKGWLMRRIVKLTYEPAHGPVYTCRFAPYLLEPSGIGYTMYFIGQSTPPDALRTYKLERVRHAELTDDVFTIPSDFDGPALLNRAWGVMSGDGELAHIKLRFSQYVARRVRETRWHLSERTIDTAEGLVWEADIGDITEIRPWIRGWGSDCEVLEPASLRDEMQAEVRRMARNYGITFGTTTQDGPNQSLLDDLLQ